MDQPASAVEPVEPVDVDAPAEPRAWWDDPRMPWRGKPSRADVWCWGLFSLTGLYHLAIIPLRPWLLTTSPLALAALTGSASSMVAIGALASDGSAPWWPLAIIVGTIGVVKFDPLYFWAGRLWGRGLLEVVAGRSARAQRRAERAERMAGRWGGAAVLLAYVIPVPTAVVLAAVAAAGMRWRTFLALDILGGLLTRGIFLWLGWTIGEPVLDVLDVISQYLLWFTIAMFVVVCFSMWRRRHD